jgi:hypothetical protein
MKKLVKLLSSFALQLPLLAFLTIGIQSVGIPSYLLFVICIPVIVAYHVGDEILTK